MIPGMSIRANYATPDDDLDDQRRRLQVVEVASKDDPILKDLWEIMVEVHRN